MSENRSFEGIWIPAALWFATDLSITEKAIFLEVKSFDRDFGCVATNKRIGEVLELKPATVSGILKVLEEKGYISISYSDMLTHAGRVVRVLKYSNKVTPQQESNGVQEKSNAPQQESIHSNNISNINSNNNLYIKAESEKDSAEGDKKESIVKAKKKKGEVRILNFSPEESKEIYGSVKQFFLDLYLREYHTEYYFEPLNGAKIHSIIRKVIFKMKEKQQREDFTKQEVIDTTNYFINTAYLVADNFLKSNFNLSNIDSKFNDSYSKISNRHNPAANINGGKPVSKFRTTA